MWDRVKKLFKTNLSLKVIIVAALLLELTTGVMYYSAQNIIQQMMERMINREMASVYHRICNQLLKEEVAINNLAWMVGDELEKPEWVDDVIRKYVENNHDALGCGVAFVPNYYAQKGYWYEPYARRQADGTIKMLQVGSPQHDYTQSEFYQETMAKGTGYWSTLYLDADGAKTVVTSYGTPVKDDKGKVVAVVCADYTRDWLDKVLNVGKAYESMQRFLTTGNYNLLAGDDCTLFKEAVAEMKASGNEEGYIKLKSEDGTKRHLFFHPVGGDTDWVLVNIVDDSEVFGTLRHVRQFLLLPVMAGLLLIGFIIYRSKRNLERLRQLNAEKERIDSELRVANRIQQSMLPKEEMRDEGLAVRGFLKPAREVGGDLYDYFVRDNQLFFCIGDVSGKGTPAALLMAVTHALFRSTSAHEHNPAHIMQRINETACQDNESNMFVTLFIGVLDLPTGHLSYCDAGHDAPVIMENGRWRMENCNPNLPVGVFDDYTYSLQETQIAPDSTIFLYTDGLTEAMNSEHQQFGLECVKTVLAECDGLQPKKILAAVTDAVRGFVNGTEQSDDLTMLAIHYKPENIKNNKSK